MMSDSAKARAAAIFRKALHAYGAKCCPVYRVEKDANGVATGEESWIGCVYGVLYRRGQTANSLIDIPGVVVRMDEPRISCAVSGCIKRVTAGDVIRYGDAWYTVQHVDVQMDIVADIVITEGEKPNGISV